MGAVVGDVVIETERLHLRHFHEGDAEFIVRLLNEPGFLRYIGDRAVRSAEDAASYIERVALASYRAHGFGVYAVELRENGTTIGMCGLMQKPWLDAPDLAYAFLAEAEGRGYASEAARAVLDHASCTLGITRIVAVAVPENVASLRVLAKLGFGARGRVHDPRDGTALELKEVRYERTA